MFYEKFEVRLQSWSSLRQELESHLDPIDRVIRFWNQAPLGARTCDPYDRSSWPDPWELIAENDYCDFTKMLAIYYTLSLTDRFQTHRFYLSVCIDRKKQELCYLLFVDDKVVGYYHDQAIDKKDLPSTLDFLANYTLMPGEYH